MLYCYDGTKEGFLTAFLTAYTDEHARLCHDTTQILLWETPVYIQTDAQKAKKAQNRLLSFDKNCLFTLDRLLRCNHVEKSQIAFAYFRRLAQMKKPIDSRLAEEEVFTAMECVKKVGNEIHKLHGFVRFMQTQSGALYAPLSPDNDLVDLLLPHFRARLPQTPFVLHDISRKKAAVYDGKNSFISYLGAADVVISADEEQWQTLWKQYYKSVDIPARRRIKQMKGYMPVRYWKFLPEKQEEIQ